MRINLGDVLTGEVNGSLRRAVVIEVDEKGSRGKLRFDDDGDERWFAWRQLTTTRNWRLDTSTRPTRRADELRAMILRRVQASPACPGGMDVEIRSVSGGKWEALSIPPAGQHIAYADCANIISGEATLLHRLFDLQSLHEATSLTDVEDASPPKIGPGAS